MKKTSVKKLLILFAILSLVIVLSSNVHATSQVEVLDPATLFGTVTPTPTTSVPTPTPTPTTSLNTVTPTSSSNYGTDSNLPKTGDASDYAIFLFIAVCAVVAIYAFRKYRNYNI